MAYVPGFQKDVFISYAREDQRWVRLFEKQLKARLATELGTACDVFRDNQIETGQKWTDQLAEAIKGAAAFLAIVSRFYRQSKPCEEELDFFLAENGARGSEDYCGYHRFFKVIQFPWVADAHETFYADYQHIEFFNKESVRELDPRSASFRNAIDTLSKHVAALFGKMLLAKAKVYVGRAPDSDAGERDAIAREIKVEGFALTPPPDGVVIRGLSRDGLKGHIEDAPVSVHVLGAEYEQDVQLQIELGIELGRKMIFCFSRTHQDADKNQKELIKQIRENKWGLERNSFVLLNCDSPSFLTDLKAELRKTAPKGSSPESEDPSPRVYLVCDPTTPEDANFARVVQERIREQEKMPVELPQIASDTFSPGIQHDRLLSDCDGLLLYCDKAPTKWSARNLADLLNAENRARSRQLKSKALLVGGSQVSFPGLTVIQRQDPFDLSQLEPFLAPLRTGPASASPSEG